MVNKTAVVLLLLLPGGYVAMGATARDWLRGPRVDGHKLADELTRVQALSPADAGGEAASLRAGMSGATGEGALARGFLLAVATERAGDTQGALNLYGELAKAPRGQPFGESALFRQSVLAKLTRPMAERETSMKLALAEPDVRGWFLTSGQWAWTGKHLAARQELVDLRSSELSFAFFAFLRKNSPWGGPMAFLGILLALSVGAKVLELPLLVKAAQTQGKMVALQPQIKRIQDVYSHDQAEMGKRLMEFYSEHGVNFKAGCLMGLADLIFVVWALVSLADFAPQMALDGSALWWMSDVTKPDTMILVVYGLSTVLSTAMFSQSGQRAQTIGGAILSGIVFCLIAYFWKWPAYLMIFWTMLGLAGMFLSILLWPVRKSAEASAY